MTKKNQKIKCDVESCKHQNTEEQVCELEEIKVSSCRGCNDDEVIENEETVCDSFDCDEEACACYLDDDSETEEEYEETEEDSEDDNDEEKEEA